MKTVLFNRSPLVESGTIEAPSPAEIKGTPSLWQSSVADALRHGGDLTRAAIGAMNIRGDRRYVLVDSKVHMLMPGFSPAIPGWHTDGAPRGTELDPTAKGAPNILAQEFAEQPNFDAQSGKRAHRFHTLVTGTASLTEFLTTPTLVEVPDEPTTDLYSGISQDVERRKCPRRPIKSCTVTEFDWWDLHRGVPASAHEWRFFIRVTETDYWGPQSDLRQVLRTQQQVYITNPAFGW